MSPETFFFYLWAVILGLAVGFWICEKLNRAIYENQLSIIEIQNKLIDNLRAAIEARDEVFTKLNIVKRGAA